MKYDPVLEAPAESEGCSDVSPTLWQIFFFFLHTALKGFHRDKNLECINVFNLLVGFRCFLGEILLLGYLEMKARKKIDLLNNFVCVYTHYKCLIPRLWNSI